MNEHSSSRWDDRSDSAWSRSPEHSSDHSSKRSSPQRQLKKEKKKAKRKKAKKRKHGKKKRSKVKLQSDYRSEGERSLSSEKKSRRSHSSSRCSSNQYQTSVRRRRHSSMSLRESRSYSRSYTSSHSRGRTRSYSPSRSRSRSRSHSLSQSKSQSYSRSRSKSRSRSRSRYRSMSSSRRRSVSRSPRKKKSSKSTSQSTVHGPNKPPDNAVTSFLRLPAAPPPESVPVIPLSDSPPPSRWKPGQKPWKPSYIHIQEIKAKVAANVSFPGPSADGGPDQPQTSVPAKSPQGGCENDRAAKKSLRSTSRSSRGRSYSRSYSRSRSRSYSRSRSHHHYHSRSSSCSQSDSGSSQRKQSYKTDPLNKDWKEYHHSLEKTKYLDKYSSCTGSQDAPSGSEKRSPDISASKRTRSSGESFKNASDWDSDSDKGSQSNSLTQVKKEKQGLHPGEEVEKKVSPLAGWNSGSDENISASRGLVTSEKEEGEASSDSDYGVCRKASEAVDVLEKKIAAITSSLSDQSTKKSPVPEKHKSKKKAKRKRKHKRSENKSSSHRGKEKGKGSKRKHQKLKEMFHWQPPLEFGEEEEEDESKRERHSPTKAVKEKPPAAGLKAKDPHLTSLNKNNGRDDNHGPQRTKHTEPHIQSSSRNAHGASGKEQDSLDDMDICTPEHAPEIAAPSLSQDSYSDTPESSLNPTSKPSDRPSQEDSVSSTAAAGRPPEERSAVRAAGAALTFKWKPLKGMSVNMPSVASYHSQGQESQNANAPGVRMEIKSKSRIRPGSLFDEVRKTARLNQRPRNQESSSEERSPSAGNAKAGSRQRSPKKSRSVPRKSRSVSSQRSSSRGWSRSYSRSRSRSRSSSYSSRWSEKDRDSFSKRERRRQILNALYFRSHSRSRRRRGRGRTHSRSSTYRSYRSHRLDLRRGGSEDIISHLIPSSPLSSVGHTAEAIPEAARMTAAGDPGLGTLKLTLKAPLSSFYHGQIRRQVRVALALTGSLRVSHICRFPLADWLRRQR